MHVPDHVLGHLWPIQFLTVWLVISWGDEGVGGRGRGYQGEQWQYS